MGNIEAIFLGIIQGLTEFFPVSSSGHLTLFQALFNIKDPGDPLLFNIVCHLGTLIAIFLVFHQEIQALFTTNRKRFIQILIGTLPLFPLVLVAKPIKALFEKPEYLGFCFLITAGILYLGLKFGSTQSTITLTNKRWRDSLVIGLFQALALFPGISRSGSTISSARVLGWAPQEAVTFSFLLAIPAILGSTILEVGRFFNHEVALSDVPLLPYSLAAITAFVVGIYTLNILKSLIMQPQKFIYFVWYCFLLGLFSVWYFNF